MPMLPATICDLVQLGPHAVAPRAPAQLETSGPGAPADMREPEEVECLRLPKSVPCAISRSMAAELDEACLVRMQRQRERRQPPCHVRPEPLSIGLVLGAHDDVIRI